MYMSNPEYGPYLSLIKSTRGSQSQSTLENGGGYYFDKPATVAPSVPPRHEYADIGSHATHPALWVATGELDATHSPIMGSAKMGMRLDAVESHVGRIVHVGMNESRITLLAEGEGTGIGTTSLGGCTAIAGSAELSDGSVLAYVSHVDPLADQMDRFNYGDRVTVGDSPSNRALVNFLAQAKLGGAIAVKVIAVYDDTNKYHPDYGKRDERACDEWHFLDQVQNTLERAGPTVRYHERPYCGGASNSTLVCRRSQGDLVFEFDGQPVDF